MGSVRQTLFNTVFRGTLRPAAQAVRRFLPDVRITRHIPTLGRFSFGLRCQPWMLGDRCLDGHRDSLAWFVRLVKPGEVFWDVGANIGYYARFVLNHCDPKAVVAVEPMSDNLPRLRRNLGALAGESAKRVTILPIALSNQAGEADLQVDDYSGGSGALEGASERAETIGLQAHGGTVNRERVKLERLDALVERDHLPTPDVVKIDVEGAEGEVLRGMSKLFDAQQRPKLIIATHGVSKVEDVLGILLPLGYTCFGVTDDSPWRRLGEDDHKHLQDNNFVASPKSEDVATAVELLDLSAYTDHG